MTGPPCPLRRHQRRTNSCRDSAAAFGRTRTSTIERGPVARSMRVPSPSAAARGGGRRGQCIDRGTMPWRLTSRQVDLYFAGPGKRGRSTMRQKLNRIDGYFAFLEQRYGGEVFRRFGVGVESPVDPFNRLRHRGDYGAAGTSLTAADCGVFRRLARCPAGGPQARCGLQGLHDGEDRLHLRRSGIGAVRCPHRRRALGVWAVGPVSSAGQGRAWLGSSPARGVPVRRGPRAALVVHGGDPRRVHR